MSKLKKKITAIMFTAMFVFAAAFSSFAEGATDPTFDVTSCIDPIKTAIFNVFTTANIVSILVAGIGGSLGFVLLWFGFRKVKGMITGAVKKGKLGG